MKKKEDEYEKEIEAKCPLCERNHKLVMYWSGLSKPRIYCPECRLKMAGKTIEKKGKFLFPY